MSKDVCIKTIEDCYNSLIVNDYWEQPSHDVCKTIVNVLNTHIIQNPSDAKAYYLRSMAKFRLIDLVPPEYFWLRTSEYAKNKMYNHDEAWEDYLKAIDLDVDIVKKTPDVRVIITSWQTGLKYYFRKPCPEKILKELLDPRIATTIRTRSDTFYIPLVHAMACILVKILNPDVNFMMLIIIALLFYFITTFTLNFILNNKINNNISNDTYLGYLEKVENATWDEVK